MPPTTCGWLSLCFHGDVAFQSVEVTCRGSKAVVFFLPRLLLTQETERRVLGTLRLSPGDTAISLGGPAPGPLTSPSHTWDWDRSTRHWGGQFGRVPHRIQDGEDRTSVEGLLSSGCAAGRGVPTHGVCYHVHFAREKPSLRRGRAGCSGARIGAKTDRREGRQERVNLALGQGPSGSTRRMCSQGHRRGAGLCDTGLPAAGSTHGSISPEQAAPGGPDSRAGGGGVGEGRPIPSCPETGAPGSTLTPEPARGFTQQGALHSACSCWCKG